MTSPLRKTATGALTLAAAVALVGSGAALPALAEGETPTPAAKIEMTDALNYKDDSFTIPTTTGVTYKYKVGAATEETTATAGAIKPFTGETAPASLKVTVLAYKTGAAATDKALKTYALSFTNKGPVVAKPGAPKVVRDKKSGLDSVTVPVPKGYTWSYTETAGVTAGSSKAVTFEATKPKAVVLKPTAGTTKITLTAAAATGYTFLDPKSAVATVWTLDVKSANTKLSGKTDAAVVFKDMPGTKDYAEITGVEGVEWKVGTSEKTMKVAKGKISKVARAKGSAALSITPVAAIGYTLADDDAAKTTTFTDTTTVTLTTPATDLTVTLAPNAAVKAWTFTPTGGKAIKLAAPKTGEVTFNLPAAGELVATAQAGYDLKVGSAAAATTAKFAVTAAG